MNETTTETNIRGSSDAVRNIRELFGMTRSEFAAYFKIPLRTLQHWEIGDRKPAPFVLAILGMYFNLQQDNKRLKEYAITLERHNKELSELLAKEYNK